MSHAGYLFLTLMCGWLLVKGGSAQTVSDSLTYTILRAQAMRLDSTNQVFASADALADAGLFTEAVHLLREFAPANSMSGKGAPRAVINHSSPASFRVSSGIDYMHIEDADTIGLSPDEMRDYKRLTEVPLSRWLRARSSIHPEKSYLEEISPEVYASERKGRLETTARLRTLAGNLHIEPAIKVEKWFIADASGDSAFEPFAEQPSDMGGTSVRLNLNNPYTSSAITSSAVPLYVDWETCRRERAGYESFIGYRLVPTIELAPDHFPLEVRLAAQAGYRNYYRPQSDYLDLLSVGTDITASLRSEKQTLRVLFSWLGDRYPNSTLPDPDNSTNPSAIDRFEASCKESLRISRMINGRLHLRGIYGSERYDESGGTDTATLWGTDYSVVPGIDVVLLDQSCTIGPELRWEQRRARKHAELMVWEARTVIEPGIRVSWSSPLLDASLLGAYRSENIDPSFPTDDSRSFRGNAECTWNIFSWVSVYLFAEYQYRWYVADSHQSENISISANATVSY